MALVTEVQVLAPDAHATQVFSAVKKPIAEHPVTQAVVVLSHLVHSPETTTYPVEQEVANGEAQVLVPGKQLKQAPLDTV